jgi:hypothetical protein
MVSPRRKFRDRSSTIAGHAVSGTWDPGVAGICTLVDAAYRREAGRVPKLVDVLNSMEVAAVGGTDDELASHTEPNIPDRLGGVEPDPEVGASAGEPTRESGLEDEGPVRGAPLLGGGLEPGSISRSMAPESLAYATNRVRPRSRSSARRRNTSPPETDAQSSAAHRPSHSVGTPAPERPETVMRRLVSGRRSAVASGVIGHDPEDRG